MSDPISVPGPSAVRDLPPVHPIPAQADRLTPAKVRGIGEDILGAQVLIDAFLLTPPENRTDADLTQALQYLGWAQKNVGKVTEAVGRQSGRGHRSPLRDTAANLAYTTASLREQS